MLKNISEILRNTELHNTYHLYRKGKFITALFRNMRILKFKSQLAIAFFAAVNHLTGPLRKQNFTLTGSKGHDL